LRGDNAGTNLGSGAFNKVFFERPSETMDQINLARILFDLKEYRKCAFNLKAISVRNQSALYLKNYATYLVCEQKQEEQSLESGDRIQAVSQGVTSVQSSFQIEMLNIET
jgi:hypothetical protein